MRADNPRDLADLLGPRNLKQEIETVNDMGFDLSALIRTETSLGNGKIADLFRREHRPLDSSRIVIGLPGDFEKSVKLSFRKHCRLVCLNHGLKAAFHLDPPETIFLF